VTVSNPSPENYKEEEMKKVNVYAYCKIYTDNFPELPEQATGQEIFDFLMSDVGCTWDEDEHLISGDLAIWYLGCNEKFGILRIEDEIWEWGMGDSSFDRVEQFVSSLLKRGLISGAQYLLLAEAIDEGRLIDNMYDITDYLKAKNEGNPWTKTKTATTFRQGMKDFLGDIKNSLQREGWSVFTSTRNSSPISKEEIS
jgi:hypothetical protein